MNAQTVHHWLCCTFPFSPLTSLDSYLINKYKVPGHNVLPTPILSLLPSTLDNGIPLDLPPRSLGMPLWQGRKEQNVSLGLLGQSQKIELCTLGQARWLYICTALLSFMGHVSHCQPCYWWTWPLKWWNKIQMQMQQGTLWSHELFMEWSNSSSREKR